LKEIEMLTGDRKTAYVRQPGGSLSCTEAAEVEGEMYLGRSTYPLNKTYEIVPLKGWPHTRAQVYKTDGGVEVLIGLED
jgi:hypothetical protein